MDEPIFPPLMVADLKLAFNRLNLPPADRLEALSLDQIYDSAKRYSLAKDTLNAGVQYVLSNDEDTLSAVLNNPNLSPQVITLLTERIIDLDLPTWTRWTQPLYRTTIRLLKHKLVVADVNLFKQAWTAFKVFNKVTDNEIGVANMLKGGTVIEDTLNLNAAMEQNNAMGIETLLFIFSHLNGNDPATLSLSLKELREEIIVNRAGELEPWIEKNMPDYIGLPLSWPLRVLDLHV
jgi:hypothetical protein